ncbi:carbohydrate esterase family 12 protein [Glonium stellatum]|uniref:Carbohydrate esterase family 12 protein n=1 Tax=Glonium stellatum TaxID=574774 RepID=A0A8E2JTA6_9PEZI|nr:carbohydrate esterase family 12 protein [Glonium stellatum]
MALFVVPAAAFAYPQIFSKRAVLVYFLLAGDSTTAIQSTGGGGWRNGFLNYTLKSGSSGHNYGHNGATTASFRSGGDWATVLSQVASHKSSYNVYVTIQFGHNDQKNTSGITLEQYTTNLELFAQEAKVAGATPILVTPLTRRIFCNGKIVESLAEQRTQTIAAAKSGGYDWIDLNIASENYCNGVGETASDSYNLTPDDHTHLNVQGSVVFGRMVSDLMIVEYADIRVVTQPNATLSALIAEGRPA